MKKSKDVKPEAKKEMKTYKAIAQGFDGVKLREVGEVFVTDIPEGEWMEEVEGADRKAVQQKHAELAKSGAKQQEAPSQNDANAKAAQQHRPADVI